MMLSSSPTPTPKQSAVELARKKGLAKFESVSAEAAGSHGAMEKRLEQLAPLALDALEEELLLGSGKDRREAAKLLLSMDGWSANDRRIQGAAPPAPVTVVVQNLPWSPVPVRVVDAAAALMTGNDEAEGEKK